MKKIVKGGLLVIGSLFLVIQFFRPSKNISNGIPKEDITSKYAVPGPVLKVLQRSCYDCHSNNTQYPWYNNIQPFAWILDNHVQEGKRELNFSVFAGYTPKKAAHKLDELISETREGAMPLSSYTAIHTDAVLSPQEVELLVAWANTLGDSIRAGHHLPALVK